MTCIVGLEHEGDVWIGGDGLATAGWLAIPLGEEKVFFNGEMLFGVCGTMRVAHLLRYALTIPEQSVRKTDISYIATDLVDAIRALFGQKGFLEKHDEKESGGCFLVGHKGKCYRVDADWSVISASDGMLAIACGAEFALGALHATEGKPPEERIQIALGAASRFSVGVKGPFTIQKGRRL